MKHLQRRSLLFKLTMFQFIILCSFGHSPFDDFDCFFRSTQLVWDQRWPPSAAFSRISLIERLRRVACPSGNSDFWRRDLGWFVMLGNWMKHDETGKLMSQFEASRRMCHLSRRWFLNYNLDEHDFHTYSHDQDPGDANEEYVWGGKARGSKKSRRSLKRGALFLGRCSWESWEVCNSAGIANKVEETWRNTFKEPQDEDRGWQSFYLDI